MKLLLATEDKSFLFLETVENDVFPRVHKIGSLRCGI